MPPNPAGDGRFGPWGREAQETLGPRTMTSTTEGGTEQKAALAFPTLSPQNAGRKAYCTLHSADWTIPWRSSKKKDLLTFRAVQ